MRVRRAVSACSQAAALGGLARRAARARSMALSTVCQSAAARGFSPASASSHEVSRSLMRAFAPARSPLSRKVFVSTTIVLNFERSPSFDGLAASAEAMMAMSPDDSTPAANNGATRIVVDRTIPWTLRIEIGLLCCGFSAPNCSSAVTSKKTIRRLVSRGSRRLFRHGLASNTVRPGTDEYDEADDHDEETKACVYGADSETAIVSRLGQQIAERGSERPRQDVGEPERQNCIGADVVGERDCRDQRSEYDDAEIEAKTERFRRESASH